MLHGFHFAAAVWAKPPTIRRGILSRDAAKALKDRGIMKLTVLNYIMFKVS